MNAVATDNQPLVGIIMGSQSDWATLEHTANMLKQLGVPFEAEVVSAHRTPDRLFEYAETARDRGIQVIIAGAGGAAHLPGMLLLDTFSVCAVRKSATFFAISGRVKPRI